jgi:hypothetical protein
MTTSRIKTLKPRRTTSLIALITPGNLRPFNGTIPGYIRFLYLKPSNHQAKPGPSTGTSSPKRRMSRVLQKLFKAIIYGFL